MGSHSKIEWTDYTFNPWWGCRKVSPGCDFCYAETIAKRAGFQVWDRGGESPNDDRCLLETTTFLESSVRKARRTQARLLWINV